MAAAYGAATVVAFWATFRFGAWVFDTGVAVWCRRQDQKTIKEKTA